MKKLIFDRMIYISVLVASLLLIQESFTQENISKKISKNYSASSIKSISIDNKYGNIDIRDWDKDKITIDVEIVLNTYNNQQKEQLLDNVNINFTEGASNIAIKTEYDDLFFKIIGRNYRAEDKKFEVNYIVNMPSTIKIIIDNKYGDVFANRINSPSQFEIKYGNLHINQLNAKGKDDMAQVTLAYSNGTIEGCQWLRADLSYSKLNINTSKALIIISKYSKLYIEKGSSIVCESKYDTYRIGSLSNFVTVSQYSNFRFDKIYKKLNLEAKYTDFRINYMSADFEAIDIENSYGSINIGIDNLASYQINGNAKYAKINIPDDSNVSRFQENNEYRINGVVGNKGSNLPIVNIQTKYGGINLVK